MGLFSNKSDEEKRAENRIDELCGGFLGNDYFKFKLKENNLDEHTSNINYKNILKDEIKNKTLTYDMIEHRLDELMKLDAAALDNKIRVSNHQDTSLFKTQQDINEFLGYEYTEKYNESLNKIRAKNLEKERKAEEKRIRNLEKEKEKKMKEEEKRIKNLAKQNEKIRKIEEKFNVDLTGKTWFQCSIEEIKYSTFNNQPNRNIDTAYVIVNRDNVEILKESVWIKSNMGSRKIFYDNITSIDFDARGVFHASSSVIINTKSAEHIQLKFVGEENFNLLNDAFENYINKPQETAYISQSSKADDLLKYAELFEKGLISKEEFNILKSEIISGEPGSVSNNDVKLENEEMKPRFCSNCGSEVDSDSKFCMNCGSKIIW